MKVNTIAIIRQYIGESKVQVEVKTGYVKNREAWDALFHKFLSNGFKYSTLRKTYIKTYYQNDYTNDRFNDDLNLVKESFKFYKHITYQSVSIESNL